ncbi:MAG: DUF1926 domain-containing protein, partial [Fidelibacterota bacterium]
RMRQHKSSEDLTQIRDDLWRSQCNCAYWHGIFGGLYMPHLRHAVYEHLLQAEVRLNGVSSGVGIRSEDVDLDGLEELEVTTPLLKAFVTPRGGALCELDYLPARFNVMNTLRRYPESYHRKVDQSSVQEETTGSIHDVVHVKEPGLKDYLMVDTSARHSLLDRFFDLNSSVKELAQGKIQDQGTFDRQLFEVNTESDSIILSGQGIAFGQAFEVIKKISIQESILRFKVQVGHLGNQPVGGLYAIEFNFSLLGGHTDDRYYVVNGADDSKAHLDMMDQLEEVSSLALITEWEGLAIQLQFPTPTTVWRYPVQTVSSSESGFEKIYQSSAVLPVYNLKLSPGEKFSTTLDLELGSFDQSKC